MRRELGLTAALVLLAGAGTGAATARAQSPAEPNGTAFDLLSLSVTASAAPVTFAGGSRQTWTGIAVSAAAGDPRGTVLELSADAERRQTADVRLGLRATTRTRTGAWYAGGAITPGASFRDRWRAEAGGDLRIAPQLQGTIDARLAKYPSGLSAAINPGATFQASRTLSVSAAMINLFGAGGRYLAGGRLRADLAPRPGIGLFASFARYPDREADDVRTLRALAAGARFDLGWHWQLRLAASDERRAASYHRQQAALSLSYRFGPP